MKRFEEVGAREFNNVAAVRKWMKATEKFLANDLPDTDDRVRQRFENYRLLETKLAALRGHAVKLGYNDVADVLTRFKKQVSERKAVLKEQHRETIRKRMTESGFEVLRDHADEIARALANDKVTADNAQELKRLHEVVFGVDPFLMMPLPGGGDNELTSTIAELILKRDSFFDALAAAKDAARKSRIRASRARPYSRARR